MFNVVLDYPSLEEEIEVVKARQLSKELCLVPPKFSWFLDAIHAPKIHMEHLHLRKLH